jgi:putative oxidoreductase
MNWLDRLRPVGLLLLRLGLGVIFVYHGYPKLFGNTERAQAFFSAVGLPPVLVYLVGIVELFSGVLLVAGLFTRVAALLLAGTMAVAIWKVHLSKGILAVNEYEFALALCVAAFALVTTGGGLLSLDYAIFRQKA